MNSTSSAWDQTRSDLDYGLTLSYAKQIDWAGSQIGGKSKGVPKNQ